MKKWKANPTPFFGLSKRRIIDHLLIDVIKLRHPRDRLKIAWGTGGVTYRSQGLGIAGPLVGTAWSIW